MLRRDGRSSFDRHDAPRYTTLATLAAEQHVVDLADAGRSAGRSVADQTQVDAAVARSDPSGDQEAVVRAVTQGGDTVICVVGPAGAGESRAMRAAAEAWTTAPKAPARGCASVPNAERRIYGAPQGVVESESELRRHQGIAASARVGMTVRDLPPGFLASEDHRHPERERGHDIPSRQYGLGVLDARESECSR